MGALFFPLYPCAHSSRHRQKLFVRFFFLFIQHLPAIFNNFFRGGAEIFGRIYDSIEGGRGFLTRVELLKVVILNSSSVHTHLASKKRFFGGSLTHSGFFFLCGRTQDANRALRHSSSCFFYSRLSRKDCKLKLCFIPRTVRAYCLDAKILFLQLLIPTPTALDCIKCVCMW